MKRLMVVLLCIFSLAMAPAFANYCHFTKTCGDYTSKSSTDNKAMAGHHCCCSISIASIANPVADTLTLAAAQTFPIGKDSFKISRTVGPPLEPPTFS